jgi:diadenosine tetraphosphatase ApaH/serine/threonine PP2A family protein phosphatase
MRYAIFTDIHANLEALEAVLARIDELAKIKPIDQIWFLGDLVGYGPNPNECIDTLRERTDVIIAGNHDWAAVGKLDLEEFSAAARISAEWTAKELTEEHREFLRNLPERLEIGDCTLVHGSPYGPLWEYLTSEVLAERSFQYFSSRFCLVGHTHVPVIFQQPYNADTVKTSLVGEHEQGEEETGEMAAVMLTSQKAELAEHALQAESDSPSALVAETALPQQLVTTENETSEASEPGDAALMSQEPTEKPATENVMQHAEDRLNNEIEELLELLGLSQSMVQATNQMIEPPEGCWEPPQDYRAIVNAGGVGQPRDGDPRAAFMIYDSIRNTFEFHRLAYAFEKTQEKIIEAGLPQYLAVRLAYGR